ncbi:SDR family oxidoreductase [Actinomadura viridis]|uniref:NAD(P)-dependent dehydrogenase (Short-subunit alcohol dehydrogenase family) n=1 Tax=Actinomadura viridis TaxID=58110 RepID=A0A931DG71_9ACTN|nr:SDR family oxidoreductase [Actinomadura viridis]MBG6088672.1 NAD(P)-dependent dehydrogenase (short-subunit alcohol dehydrogenase family) [Actinomadura viridis]
MDGTSYVVTGGGRGVGRAVVERLLAQGGHVVVIELDARAAGWAAGHPSRDRLATVAGDASAEEVTAAAVEEARARAPLAGWVNNAAVFHDASLHESGAAAVLDLIGLNLGGVVAGCAAAVRAFLAAGTGGAIVNVSSHQARRPVAGCLPYATAKAAIEGLTRALAVDYGPHGIRANAVALGTIAVERYQDDVARLGPDRGAAWHRATASLHALERVGRPEEAAEAITYLLSPQAGFISGATLPVDGGRSVLAREPQP